MTPYSERYLWVLNKYIKPGYIYDLFKRWKEPHRKYHNINHLDSVLKELKKQESILGDNNSHFHSLILAAFFHDVIYIPGNPTNEEESIQFYKDSCLYKPRKEVEELILVTKSRTRPKEKYQQIFWDADNHIFIEEWDKILEWEKGIREEFKEYPLKEYKKERMKFLRENLETFGIKGNYNIKTLIDYIKYNYHEKN